jgi:hypothetical protein
MQRLSAEQLERLAVQDRLVAGAVQRGDEHRGQAACRVGGLRGAVGRAGAQRRQGDRVGRVTGEGHRDGRELHERAVAGGVRRDVAGVGLPGALEALEGRTRRVADVEAAAGGRPLAVAVPAPVALELVDRVEAAPGQQRVGQAQRHRRVVGPRAGGQVERPAADHVGHRREGPGRLELDGGAERVADGQPEQGAAEAVAAVGAAHARSSASSSAASVSSPPSSIARSYAARAS